MTNAILCQSEQRWKLALCFPFQIKVLTGWICFRRAMGCVMLVAQFRRDAVEAKYHNIHSGRRGSVIQLRQLGAHVEVSELININTVDPEIVLLDEVDFWRPCVKASPL